MSDLVLAATSWPTNAALIADVARLGYLHRDALTLDPTYGKGAWWTDWRPDTLVTHDKYKLDGVDFRDLPHPDCSFDTVAFDPPYVCPGGRSTSTTKDMHARYGMNGDDFRTPTELQTIIDAGLAEMHRVVRPKGTVLVKCKDYIWSGRLWIGTHHTLTRALDLGFDLVDRLEHVGNPGPQSQTRQVHARRNLSTLFVLRRPPAPNPCRPRPPVPATTRTLTGYVRYARKVHPAIGRPEPSPAHRICVPPVRPETRLTSE